MSTILYRARDAYGLAFLSAASFSGAVICSRAQGKWGVARKAVPHFYERLSGRGVVQHMQHMYLPG